eukprot:11095081-Prorocentrum_lima.AAC.1
MPQGPFSRSVAPVLGPYCLKTDPSLVVVLSFPGLFVRVRPCQRLSLHTVAFGPQWRFLL